MEKITQKQKILIHLALSQLKMTREQYEMMLSDYWVKSSVDLSFKDAEHLINRLIKLGFKIITRRYERKKTAPNIIRLVSKEQLAKIEHLKQDVRWHVHDGYNRWLMKYLKKNHITTSREANNVIEALKGMLRRQEERSRTSRNDIQESQHLRHDGGQMHGGYWRW